jgi:TPR repeat protein
MGDDVGAAVPVVPVVPREVAAVFLRTLGHDVEATRAGAGEGFDLRGPDVVVLVGDPTAAVGLAELQRLTGVAAVEHLRPAAVAVQPYPDDAAVWATRADVALFALTAEGRVGAVNDVARNWTSSTPGGEPALRRSAVDGDAAAMTGLARLLIGSGRRTEAALWYRRAVEAGAEGAWRECAELLAAADATAQLWSWCRDFAERAHPEAMLALADLHAAAGEADAEVAWLTRCVDAGRSERALRLGELYEAAGRTEEALRAYRIAADAGDTAGARHIARLLRNADPAEAERAFRQAADDGDLQALHDLARLLDDGGRRPEALDLLRRGADLGSAASAVTLGRLLFEAGDVGGGETWLRVAGEAGEAAAEDELTRALEALLETADEAGHREAAAHWRAKLDTLGTDRAWLALGHRAWRLLTLDEAVAYFRKVAEHGHVDAMIALADVLRQMDSVHEAYDWYLKAAQRDHADAMLTVGELLFGWSLFDKGALWLERAREHGHPRAAQVMVERIDEALRRAERLGDDETATRFLARLRSLDTVPAFRVLAARAYADHDDHEYELWLRRAAEAGDPESMGDLGKRLWLGGGEGQEALQWCRRAVAGGHWPALYVLDHLLGEDLVPERVSAWRISAEAGWLPGLEWMATRGAVDDAERERWAAAAADAGSSVAYHLLGRLALDRGDNAAGEQWLVRGAEEEDRDAMFTLAQLRAAIGDVDGAKRWFLDAAALEHKESADRLVALLRAEDPPDRELVGLWEKLFATSSDKQEASVARALSAAYKQRGDERVAARLAALAASLR